MKQHTYIIPSLIAAAVVSCENPADRTTTASVSEAQGSTSQSESENKDPVFKLNADSTVGFVGSKVTGSHEGGFRSVSGHLHISNDDEVSGGLITIDMNSTWSDNDKLTEHLKAPDFFDVGSHPESTFSLTKFRTVSKESGSYEVSGDLKMRGVTKNVTFPATASKDGETIKVNAEFDINRKDWGIEYEGKKDDLIRDEVVLTLNLIIEPKG